MRYRQALLTRWTRRDRLAVLLIAVTVAFLTGTVLVIVAMGAQTAAIAGEYDATGSVTYHDSLPAAQAAAGSETIIVPVASVTANGTNATVVGPPRPTWRDTTLRTANATTRGTLASERRVAFTGDRTITTLVQPRTRTIFPADWYVTDSRTVRQLGVDGAFVVAPPTGPTRGVPLRGALAFFLAGTREAIAAFGVAAGGGGLLVAVTTFSVMRLTVRDRLATIRVIRATGGTPSQVRNLFLARALLLLGIGTAAGYAIGVVGTNTVVTAAVAAGLPTSLSMQVSSQAAGVLGPVYVALLGVGMLAALLAIWPAAHTMPAALGDTAHEQTRLPGPLAPRLLGVRVIVPTAATLAAFVMFVLLVAGLAGTVAPLAGGTDATVTEPGAIHPVASTVPAEYATALQARGIDASPEILLFAIRDGQPFLARGANYSAFASVSDVDLVRGTRPTGPRKAVIGADLARTLDLGVEDTLTVGGSTHAAVTRVRIVGVFTGTGSSDDQLVVPLETARHLSGKGGRTVQFIRADRLPEPRGQAGGATVLGVDAPDTAPAGGEVQVRVRLRNDGLQRATLTETVRFAGATRTLEAMIPAAGTTTVTTTFSAPAPGQYELHVGGATRTIRVLPADAIRLVDVPAQAPPGSEPLVRVVTVDGRPVADATVTVGNRSVRTDATGRARVPLQESGTRTVVARLGNRTDETTIRVDEGAPRLVHVTVRISPERPSVFTEPTLSLSVSNPWNETLTQTLTVEAPGGPTTHRLTLSAGESTRLSVTLPRQPPGQYDVTVRGEAELAQSTYRVVGDDRIVAALAAGGQQGSTGIGRAIQVAFGNIQIALGALLVLGAVMAVSGTAATFAGAVHGRRRTIGIMRATGCDPFRVGRLVVGDALRIGVLAASIAIGTGLVAMLALGAAGVLTVYGVRIPTTPDPVVVTGLFGGSVLLTAVGAGVATLGLVRVAPARLLTDDDRLGGGDQRD